MPSRISATVRILPIVLPLAGAVVGPFMAGEYGHWLVRSLAGAFIGLSGSFLVWQSRTVPPYSTYLGRASACSIGIGLLIMAFFAWNSDYGTFVVIAVISSVLGWTLTR